MKTIVFSRALWAILTLAALLFTACPTGSDEQDAPTAMPTTSLHAALSWLESNAAGGGVYTITLSKDESIAPQTLSYSGKKVGIILTGGDSERTVGLSSTGALFTVEKGVTLILQANVALQGRTDNTASLVKVNSGGALEMQSGSKITGNTASSYGGGVSVSGTFTMSGGAISGNIASSASYGYNGGGVFVNEGASFTQSGGTISGNTAYNSGGGVYAASGGTFTMSGGAISGNTASGSTGGGVFVDGTFTQSGGIISGNTASLYGGGVFVNNSGTFAKQSGGVIYGSDADSGSKNTAAAGGRAVYASVYSGSKQRNSTAGEGVTLDSTKDADTGGWE